METTKVKYRKWLEHKDDYYKYRKKFLENRNKLVDESKDSRHKCFCLLSGDQIFYRFFLAVYNCFWNASSCIKSVFVWEPYVAHTQFLVLLPSEPLSLFVRQEISETCSILLNQREKNQTTLWSTWGCTTINPLKPHHTNCFRMFRMNTGTITLWTSFLEWFTSIILKPYIAQFSTYFSCTLPKTNTSPENWWLEHDFSF